MHFLVYIIYSERINRFYVGTTDDFARRLKEHNSMLDEEAFTFRGRPWQEYLVIDGLSSEQAFRIEEHIKKMKSVKYIQNLKAYPEMRSKLVERYR